jgi:hypothetical protein
LLDCVLISSDEAFRHVVLGILRQPANQARLALDLQVLAEGLNRESVARVLKARPRWSSWTWVSTLQGWGESGF